MTLEEKVKYLEEKVKLYRFDFLTGMKQRIDFELEVKDKFDKGENFVFAMYDVVGLHEVNRKKGFDFGDALIKRVAYHIRIQEGVICSYRIGGDEFVAIFAENAEPQEINFATLAYDESKKFKTFDDLMRHVDKKLSKKKRELKRRRKD